jgi:subtilisin family serine protease
VDTASLCGALVVAAAGNEHLQARALRRSAPQSHLDTELLCPAQARGAITVGAIAKEPTEALYSASSRGPTSYGLDKPELLAPGVDVTSTIPAPAGESTLFNSFGVASGTSVAAAVVAGAVALLIERRRATDRPWSPQEIRGELLAQCTRPLSGPSFPCGPARTLDLASLDLL